MQVTHQNDHVTHAVIGGADAIEFGMSNSAEFFHILSSTLYKNQELAVVREVLCNAWDAHIEAGMTHIPVQLTLTDEKFVIKDVGTGIHRDDMGIVYGTYGHSTKKNDGKQTGGFGLGCKAPFAYTDHFEVQSCHDGVRTIYNISKSSAQALGKPGIVPIASIPTTDTGLTVTVPIKAFDRRKFEALIKRIVRNGDMNMTLNGEAMEKIGFDTSKANYMITSNDWLVEDRNRILIRYGNVIYPVDKVAELAEPYNRIEEHLQKLHYRNEYRIVFQAPPHSITVQPSREGLSMQEQTIGTLRKLMLDFIGVLGGEFLTHCGTYAKVAVNDAVKEKRVGELLVNKPELPLNGNTNIARSITDLGVMVRQYMAMNYPNTLAFRKEDIAYRLKQMMTAGLLDRGQVQTWLAALRDVDTNHTHMNYADTDWLQKKYLAPIIKKMLKADIDYKRLYLYDATNRNAPKNTYGAAKEPVVPVVSALPTHHFSTLPYLRNIVVLHRTRKDLTVRAYKHDVFKANGAYDGFLFYHIGMRKNEKDNAIAFFTGLGMKVVDLTIAFSWEVASMPSIHHAATPRAAKKVGLPPLSCIRGSRGDINIRRYKDYQGDLLAEPEAIILLPIKRNEGTSSFDRWDREASHMIIDLFGDKVGVASSTTNQATWVKKGAKEFDVWIREKLFDFMKTNANLAQYWGYDLKKAMHQAGSEKGTHLMQLIYKNKELRQEFGVINQMTEEEKKYLALFRKLTDSYYGRTPADILLVRAHLDALPVQQATADLVQLCKDSKFVHALDVSTIESYIEKKMPGAIEMAIKLIYTVLL